MFETLLHVKPKLVNCLYIHKTIFITVKLLNNAIKYLLESYLQKKKPKIYNLRFTSDIFYVPQSLLR